ncbi:hypothetical protein [Psychrobacter immobilis]|nr:hypothetical protein [Psychrobacter immobilis]
MQSYELGNNKDLEELYPNTKENLSFSSKVILASQAKKSAA